MGPQPTRRMDADAVWTTIDRERLELADLLDGLTDEEWERPSLCAGWRVRDVVAHLALAHTGPARAAVDLARARGSLPRMIHDTAVRHAELPPAALVAQIRAMAGSRRTAPGVSHLEPLLDVLVHGQDIALPLGRSRPMPVDAAATAATRVWTMPWPMATTFSARRRLRGLRLTATDADWAAGDGEPVEGPIEALLLLLTGRTAALDRLTGAGAARLR
ncbi:maleylpyruvate isomerase family mycothiol-dependent enzyme [Blastococcus sp. TF02A-30]|uniref:maleylpyruvate isomerase family mycothiol-dependent enzyme n=1 Tax=Blastococcus sp. TF02A-30 TaxID=2250580 RepID=UPI001F3FFCCF|nr:maleylpyruvate isomerase family mycothiol-dependent enzyme [Blastococcus sp. TF02A-30]